MDLKAQEGQEIIRKVQSCAVCVCVCVCVCVMWHFQLASKADILLHNYVPGNMEHFGLGYEDLAPLNPGLIYCSITGFGETGPYADRGGYDVIASGLAGLMHLTGPKVQ